MSDPSAGQTPPPPESGRPRWGHGRPRPASGAQPSNKSQPQWGQSASGVPYGAPPPPQKRRRKWPWVLLGVVILMAGGCVAIIAGISEEASKTVKVSYEVTGKASDVVITYSTWHGDTGSTSQETVKSLPWTKEETTTGLAKGGTLTATLGASGGSLKCSVTVDDGKPKTATASGPFASASCSGF